MGCTGKQAVRRGGRGRWQLDFGSYKLHESKTSSFQWVSLCYWEDFADVHWGICRGMGQRNAFRWGVGHVLPDIPEDCSRAQWTPLRTLAIFNRPDSTAAGMGRSQRTKRGSTAGSSSALPTAGHGLPAEQPSLQEAQEKTRGEDAPSDHCPAGGERHWVATRKVTVRNRLAWVDMLFQILLFRQFSIVPQIFSIAHTKCRILSGKTSAHLQTRFTEPKLSALGLT